MSNEKNDFLAVLNDFKDYLKTCYNLAVLKASDKGSNLLAGIIVGSLIGILVLFSLLFASISLAIYFKEIFHSTSMGFLAVAIVYLFLSLLVIAFRNLWLKRYFVNMIIRRIFRKEEI